MINAVLEHVPIKLENFNDESDNNDDMNSNSNSNDGCSTLWRASSTSSSEPAAASISRTSSTTTTTTTPNLELDDIVENCGNVFIYSRRKLFLICGFCDSKYANMLQFAKHLNDCHKIFYPHLNVDESRNEEAMLVANDDSNSSSSLSQDSSGLIVKGGFQIRFVGEGSASSTQNGKEDDKESLPTPADVLLRHVPIKVEDDDQVEILEDEKAMLDFENNIESCGNIFVMNRRKLFLICGFCEGKFANMELFATHLHEYHTIFEEDQEQNVSIRAPQPVQIKEEPEEVLVPVKRRSTGNKDVPMVAIPTSGILATPEAPPAAATKRRRVVRESQGDEDQSDRSSSKDDCDTISVISVNSEVSEAIIPKETELYERGVGINRYTCRKCPKGFHKLSRMIEHVRIHTGEKPHECPECGKRFRIKLRLTEHQMRHRAVKAFKCDICGLGCATRQDYALHQRHHNGDKRYSCGECGKAFVRSQDLRTHLRIHTDERPFECEICKAKFRAKQNLLIHRKMHDSLKPFKCEYCEKTFRRNIDRKAHHRTHTGEKAFKCEICGRGFSAKVHVRKHIEKRHIEQLMQEKDPGQDKKPKSEKKEKQFKCTNCPKEYTSKANLEKHVKKVHATAAVAVAAENETQTPTPTTTTKENDSPKSTQDIVPSQEVVPVDP